MDLSALPEECMKVLYYFITDGPSVKLNQVFDVISFTEHKLLQFRDVRQTFWSHAQKLRITNRQSVTIVINLHPLLQSQFQLNLCADLNALIVHLRQQNASEDQVVYAGV